MNEFKTEDAKFAWLAGICDCDSAICLEKTNRKDCKRTFSWMAFIKITQKNPALIMQLKHSFPDGNVNFANYESGKRLWSYRMFSNQLRVVLPNLLPYLTNKKDQAILLLQALSLLSEHHGYYTPNDVRIKEIWKEIKNLHHRKGYILVESPQ